MRTRLVLPCIVLLAPAATLAQPSGETMDVGRFSFRIGAQIFSSFTTQVRIDDFDFDPGTEIELENVTDLEERITIGRIDGSLAFGRRHALSFSYYDIERRGGKNLDVEIEWEGEIYPVGIDVESRYEQRTFKVAYDFSFLKRPRSEMAFGAGLHTMDFVLGLNAIGQPLESEVDALAPLPVLGLSGKYQLSDKWRFSGRIDWLDVEVGNYKGVFTDAVVAFEHQTFEQIGFGVGANLFDLDLEAEDEDLTGQIDLGFDSFMIYMSGRFGRR